MSKYTIFIFDVERENKSPRHFVVPHVPSEIYLVVMPSGGQDDYETPPSRGEAMLCTLAAPAPVLILNTDILVIMRLLRAMLFIWNCLCRIGSG